MILEETADTITVQVDDRLADRLREKRVFFETSLAGHRLKDYPQTLEARKTAALEPYCSFEFSRVLTTMGSFSYTRSLMAHGVSVGRYSSIGLGLSVPQFRHPLEFATSSPVSFDSGFVLLISAMLDDEATHYRQSPLIARAMPSIGHDVWVGDGVVLMPGVKVGDGAVLAAASVITKDVAPYAIVGGNPATVIRPRFDPLTVAALIQSRWWRYKATDLKGLPFEDPARFLKGLERREVSGAITPWEPEPAYLHELVRELDGAG